MKKVFYLTLTALFCLIVLTACDRKQRAIDNLSEFVEKVEKHAPEYTAEDWKEINKEYDELIAEISKYDYSIKDAERIEKLKGKYDGIRFKDTLEDVVDGVDKTIHKVKKRVDGFIDGIIGNEVQPLTNETDSSENIN